MRGRPLLLRLQLLVNFVHVLLLVRDLLEGVRLRGLLPLRVRRLRFPHEARVLLLILVEATPQRRHLGGRVEVVLLQRTPQVVSDSGCRGTTRSDHGYEIETRGMTNVSNCVIECPHVVIVVVSVYAACGDCAARWPSLCSCFVCVCLLFVPPSLVGTPGVPPAPLVTDVCRGMVLLCSASGWETRVWGGKEQRKIE